MRLPYDKSGMMEHQKKKKKKGMEYNSMNKTKNDERKLIPTNEQK